MNKSNKKTISIVVIIALVFSSYGCLELWASIYASVSNPLQFMAITAPVIFAYGFTSLMLLRSGVIAANLLNSSPPLTAVIKPPRVTLLVYTIVMVWVVATGLVIFNGFDSLNASNNLNGADMTIGYYRIIQPNGSTRRTSNVIATGSNTAFIDLNDSGLHETEWEPGITYDSDFDKMTIQFPPWSGGPGGTPGYDITDYGVLELKPGIFTFTGAEAYQVDWTFTSIDPDTGGADDNQGASPMVKNFTSTVFRWGVPTTGGNFLLLNE